MQKIVYHYCSVETFLNIVKNKKIWLSHSRVTNDSSECIYALKYIKDVLKHYKSTKVSSELVEDIINEVYTMVDFPYIFCCSKKKDLLSQWRAYGDNGRGVAIGFNISKIPHYDILGEGDSSTSLIIDEVTYRINGFDKLVKKVIKTIPELKRKGLNEDKIKQAIIEFYKMLSIFIKDINFKEECEVRFAYRVCYIHLLRLLQNTSDKNILCSDNMGIQFRTNASNNIVSYFELDIPDDAICQVVLGPKSNIDSNQLTLFLSQYLPKIVKNKKILKSQIPYV